MVTSEKTFDMNEVILNISLLISLMEVLSICSESSEDITVNAADFSQVMYLIKLNLDKVLQICKMYKDIN